MAKVTLAAKQRVNNYAGWRYHWLSVQVIPRLGVMCVFTRAQVDYLNRSHTADKMGFHHKGNVYRDPHFGSHFVWSGTLKYPV